MAVIETVRGEPLGRPVSLNDERSAMMHWGGRSSVTDKWRRGAKKRFRQSMTDGELWPVEVLVVQVVPVYRTLSFTDVGAVFPSVKACIDALVDLDVMADDNPPHHSKLVMGRPRHGMYDGLVFRLTEGERMDGHPYGTCGCLQVRKRKEQNMKNRRKRKTK